MDETLRRLFNQAKKDSSLWPDYLEACKRAGRHAWRKCLAQMHYAGGSVAPEIWQEFLVNPTWRLMRSLCVFRLAGSSKIDQKSLFQTLIEANAIIRSFSVDVDNGGQIFVNYSSQLHLWSDPRLGRLIEAEKIIAELLGWDFQRDQDEDDGEDGDEDEEVANIGASYVGYTGIYDSDSKIDDDFQDEPQCKKSSIELMLAHLRIGITLDRKIVCWWRNIEDYVSQYDLDTIMSLFDNASQSSRVSPEGHLFISTNIQLNESGIVQG